MVATLWSAGFDDKSDKFLEYRISGNRLVVIDLFAYLLQTRYLVCDFSVDI